MPSFRALFLGALLDLEVGFVEPLLARDRCAAELHLSAYSSFHLDLDAAPTQNQDIYEPTLILGDSYKSDRNFSGETASVIVSGSPVDPNGQSTEA